MLKPSDFIKNFSPHQKADFFLYNVDERSVFDKNFLFKYLFRSLNPLISKLVISKRDKYIETLFKEIEGDVLKYLRKKFSHDHLRKLEYPFLAQCLMKKSIKKDVTVDFGGGGSFSAIIPVLLKVKFKRLLSIDCLDFPLQSKYGIEYIKGDITKTSLPDQSVDLVTIISTLEHVGLGRYGDELDTDGDINTMREAWRILKKGGYAVLTIPYGYPTVVFNMHRIYDRGRVKLLAKKFRAIHVQYSLHGHLCKRVEVEGKKVTKKFSGPPDAQGGIMMLLKKI